MGGAGDGKHKKKYGHPLEFVHNLVDIVTWNVKILYHEHKLCVTTCDNL